MPVTGLLHARPRAVGFATGYTVAVLSNDDGGARRVSAKLRALIAGGA